MLHRKLCNFHNVGPIYEIIKLCKVVLLLPQLSSENATVGFIILNSDAIFLVVHVLLKSQNIVRITRITILLQAV